MLTKLFGLKGRLRRRDYWLLTLLTALVMGLLLTVFLIFVAVPAGWIPLPNPDPTALPPAPTPEMLMISWGAYLVVAWPLLAIALKRLHDRNKSAVWLIPYGALPLALTVLMEFAPQFSTPWLVLVGASTLVGLVMIIDLGFLKGTEGPNQYGPDPLWPGGSKKQT